MQCIHQVQYGVCESEVEDGDHFYVCNVGIWIEMRVRNGQYPPTKQVGARWTTDAWETYHDAFAVLKQPVGQEEELWRVEIDNIVTTGWRSGSIGGPNGEQPSSNVWTLWGPSKQDLSYLPLGGHVPEFEFALFVKTESIEHWENNAGFNYKIDLSQFGKHPQR